VARQWIGKCATCNGTLSYCDHFAQRNASLGRPRTVQCGRCLELDARGIKATAAPELLLERGAELGGPGPLGDQTAPHRLDARPSGLVRAQFGVGDDEIQALYAELQREDTPVVIAVAPTGSGKSTFLPYRLLVPDGLPAEAFTRGRQIVITQPRRAAATGIPGYVSKVLHGANLGVGHEIGYRVRGDARCDAQNRLVYVTDGTLITWLARGELDRIAMIVIDEAHERSLNIDIILGLVTRCLPQYPHLKLLIVSATIDHEKFRSFFESQLPGHLRCGVVKCSGTKPVGLTVHFRRTESGELGYGHGPLKELGKTIALDLADAIVRLVVAMDAGVGGPTNLAKGDVVGFLHGERPIQEAVEHIEQQLRQKYPALAANTDVYPLFAAVDDKTRLRATGPKERPSRRRIVIASNAAETSLTIEGLVHVVDSGFIKQTLWDPLLGDAPLLPIAHSQAGCRQRWGRVGRTAEGFAWCLYTKAQFESIFPRDTKPEIQRSCLDGVVLLAKRGGADRVDPSNFPWLDPPSEAEIKSSLERLQRQGALDADGDLTEVGVALALSGGEDAAYARFVADADRFGFGVEVATLLPYFESGLRELFPDPRALDPAEQRAVRAAHQRVRAGCVDDLELCLRVFCAWQQARDFPQLNGISATAVAEAADARAETLRRLGSKKKELEDRELDFAGLDRLRVLAARAFPDQVYTKVEAAEGAITDDEVRYEPWSGVSRSASGLTLDVASVGRLRPPTALVALGPKRHRRGATPGEVADLVAGFVIAIDPAVFEATAGLGDLELANYFREHMPRPLRASEEDRRARLHARLREEYPVGSLVECRVRSVYADVLEVDVLHNVGWGGQPLSAGLQREWREGRADALEREVDFRYEKGARPPRGRSNEAEDDRTEPSEEPEDDADEIRAELARAPASRRREDRLPGTRTVGRLRRFGQGPAPAPGALVTAEVTQHAELLADPGLILVSPPRGERFRSFTTRYAAGHDVEVQVIGCEGSASMPGLLVRERLTGFETLVAAEDVMNSTEIALLRSIPIGAMFPLTVRAIDEASEQVTLSGLSRVERQVKAILGGPSEPRAGRVASLDVDERCVYVHVLLNASEPERGIVVGARLVMARTLFEISGSFRPPFKLGDVVHVTVRRDERPHSRNAAPGLALVADRFVTDLEHRFPQGKVVDVKVLRVEREGIYVAAEGGIRGLIAVKEVSWWTERPFLQEFAKDGDACKAVVLRADPRGQNLELSLKRLRPDPWEGTIHELYSQGKLVVGIVRQLQPFGAFVRVEPGLDGLVHISAMRSFHGRHVERVEHVVSVDDEVLVKVRDVDVTKRTLSLELSNVTGRKARTPSPRARSQAPKKDAAAGGDTAWPWDEGENAIATERKPPSGGKPPAPPGRAPLEKRPLPLDWSLRWR
jgi:predicted RNA-binding protein with RPS1 domain